MAQAVIQSEPITPQLLDRARQLLAKAETLPEILKIRNMATAAEQYFKASNQAREIVDDAAEIKVRSERKLGEMLSETRLRGERARHGHYKKTELHDVTQLSDIGITKIQSHRWQQIAAIPTEKFDAYVQHIRINEDRQLTASGLIRMARKDVPDQEDRKRDIALFWNLYRAVKFIAEFTQPTKETWDGLVRVRADSFPDDLKQAIQFLVRLDRDHPNVPRKPSIVKKAL